jgi:hypothetical protein
MPRGLFLSCFLTNTIGLSHDACHIPRPSPLCFATLAACADAHSSLRSSSLFSSLRPVADSGCGLPEPGAELRIAVLPDPGPLVRQLPDHSGFLSAHSQHLARLLPAVREVPRSAQGLHVRKYRVCPAVALLLGLSVTLLHLRFTGLCILI